MSLLKTLRNNQEVRKIFGNKEIEIIEKQLLGIKLKPSEKTRLSRDIRKKLKVIKALSHYQEEFELKYASEIKKRIKEIKEIILETKYFSKIKKIILFGTSAENKRSFLSDIDLAVEFSEITKKDSYKFRLEVLRLSPEKTDIQVYNFLPKKIKEQINKKGKLIYERKN